jgi:hypothetical protein
MKRIQVVRWLQNLQFIQTKLKMFFVEFRFFTHATARYPSEQDSNQTVLKSSTCTSNTDSGTVPKIYGVATEFNSDANITTVKITGSSEEDVTHVKGCLLGKTAHSDILR